MMTRRVSPGRFPGSVLMDLNSIREYSLSLPHATEGIQWGNDLLFRISGKIFAVMSLDPPHTLAFKCTPEKFDELIEFEGIVPAPYMARNKWVMLERLDALRSSEIKSLIKDSYELVFSKLTKKAQTELGSARKTSAARKRPRKSS
jgi:predicted DNA-binding protein (MmcQ/YjbR family)